MTFEQCSLRSFATQHRQPEMKADNRSGVKTKGGEQTEILNGGANRTPIDHRRTITLTLVVQGGRDCGGPS